MLFCRSPRLAVVVVLLRTRWKVPGSRFSPLIPDFFTMMVAPSFMNYLHKFNYTFYQNNVVKECVCKSCAHRWYRPMAVFLEFGKLLPFEGILLVLHKGLAMGSAQSWGIRIKEHHFNGENYWVGCMQNGEGGDPGAQMHNRSS